MARDESAGTVSSAACLDLCLNSACQVARPYRRFQSARISRAAFAPGPRGTVDALIAGLAWFMEATVATRNPRDFEGMGVPVLAY